ncbi:MAG: CRISPR-associated CARF protein Csa3 [Candidatus Micrarchaeota archaeon]|nr:CRISPR locus-related DNA-binding protein [Candidatus Micrarchaeota archaeon]MBU1887342.1 CRISPR locus-related DNA-binding protein [Candidatus Micrarchaeota archaeon]
MEKTVLISTFYSFEPLVASATAYSPSRIALLVAGDSLNGRDGEKVKANISKAKDVYGSVAPIEVIKVNGSDLVGVAKKTVELLENEEGKKIVNISGGWKLLAQGVLYGCYARPELVEKIVCNNIEDNTLIELPKLSFNLSSAKKELLEELLNRNGKAIAEIAKKLDKTRGMLYQHLKELKENGYVDDKFDITLAGRMALI